MNTLAVRREMTHLFLFDTHFIHAKKTQKEPTLLSERALRMIVGLVPCSRTPFILQFSFSLQLRIHTKVI